MSFLRSRRRRAGRLLPMKWFAPPLGRRTRPFALILKRLAAARLVFIFGIVSPLLRVAFCAFALADSGSRPRAPSREHRAKRRALTHALGLNTALAVRGRWCAGADFLRDLRGKSSAAT